MDLRAYRLRPQEQERVSSLLDIIPSRCASILEIGARDGYISKRLKDRIEKVVALDLCRPRFHHPGVVCVQADVTHLSFADKTFDCVLCSEVLEHIPPALVEVACHEMVRVARHAIVVGVPFEQDTRIDRTTCVHCGGTNPPYGHVNSFNAERLQRLFNNVSVREVVHIGRRHRTRTNAVSVALMDLAGNPFGTYEQEEGCIHCGRLLVPPPPQRPLLKRLCSKLSWTIMGAQNILGERREVPVWIHMVFSKECR